MQGTRVKDIGLVWEGDPGAYCPLFSDGQLTALWFKLPTGSVGRIPNIGHGTGGEPEWTITANEDGSITVDPSIEQHEVKGGPEPIPYWHGHLVAGEWRG